MEINFKHVHTTKDIAISSIVIIAGVALFFASKALGAILAVCGLVMLLIWKSGYKTSEGPVLTKKAFDVAKSCRTSILDFLEGKDAEPLTDKPGAGGVIRLETYFNKEASVAYVQVFDFKGYNYEKATDLVELQGERADKFISKL